MSFRKYYPSFFLLLFLISSCGWFVKKPRIGFPSFSPNGQYLLFHTDQKEGRVIYRSLKNGTEFTQLTRSGEDNFDPAYSPDGSKIVFAKTPSGKFGEEADLYVMNSDGSGRKRLTTGPAFDSSPVFGPDGRRIYFIRARWFGHHSPFVSSSWKDKDIYSIDVDGSNLQAITDGWYYEMSRPSVSGDGKDILVRISIYENPDSLWIIPLESPKAMKPIRPKLADDIASLRESAKSPYAYFYDPQFSPDGKSIVFTQVAGSSDRGYFEYEIYLMDVETKDVRKLTNLGLYTASPSFSPDGKEIIFLFDHRWPNQNNPNEVWIMNADGADPRRIDIKL